MRLLVLVLLLANLGFCAWTQGWLDNVVGVRARGDREPERLLHQLHPETVMVVPPGTPAAAPPAPPASAPLACLEAGPFDAVQVVAATAALKAAQPPLPDGSWVDVKAERPGSWSVYMGRFAGAEPLAKKEDELRRRKLDFEEVHASGLEPGLSLGRFDNRTAADEALAALTQQGVRTARVVELTPPSTSHMLRVDRADTALAGRFAAMQGGPFGSGFLTCGETPKN